MTEGDAVEAPEEQGGCAGYLVLAVLVSGAVVGLFLVSRTVFILTVWGAGWAAVVWAARKPVGDAPNPAPPPLPERGPAEEPQVTLMRDQNHPNRWIVARPSPWLSEPIRNDEKAGT